MIIGTLRFMKDFPRMLPGLLDDYHAQIERVNQYDPERFADHELVGIIRETVYGPTSKLLNYDYLMIAVIKRVYIFLGTLLEPYFGEEAESIRGKLISGVTGNLTMETNINIWDLAQFAKASPQVDHLFRSFTGDELLARLADIEDGRAFLEELDKFLKIYGHREVRMDIIYPTWCDDPSPILSFIRGYLDLGEAHSPHAQQKHLSQQRQEVQETVRKRLRQELKGRYLIWPLFRWLLDNIEFHARERDTMHFEMTRIFPPFRRFLLELGRRWTERGLLAEPEQIYFLTFPEIEDTIKDPQPMLETATQRQEEYEINKGIPWPDIIRGDQESYSRPVEPVQGEAGRLDGVAGSPGVITGQARVIRGPEEFHRLQHGEILVAPLTNPVWTPLFAIASGVITEVGGILSHGAIVAREYGIPAVMSIASATQHILDGQTITVDGDRGLVYTSIEAAA
jgi:pyruvate,water dikinase